MSSNAPPAQAPSAGPLPGPANPSLSLFLLSVLSLFLELLLIRWVGTEIRIFAYLQNTVLVVCFLGLGMGCWTCRQPIDLRRTLVPLAVLVILVWIPATRVGLLKLSDLLGSLRDFVMFGQATGLPWYASVANVVVGLAATFLLMLLIWMMFVPLGRMLGRMLDDAPDPIGAYSVNVAGSLIGIWLFAWLSSVYAPPGVWLSVTALLAVVFLVPWRAAARAAETPAAGAAPRPGPKPLELIALLVIVVGSWFISWEPGARRTVWSPYQKLVLLGERTDSEPTTDLMIAVNNTGYQAMLNLQPGYVNAHPEFFDPKQRGFSQYDIPPLLYPGAKKCLVVGAGSGNDIAGLLRHGAESVTAVEIDPAIVQMGRDFHPEHPYDSPAVKVVLDDARSYFAGSTEKFDLIIFGLLDSHTSTAMNNTRLDHYVYTRESLAKAKELLADNGVLVLSFEAQRHYIAVRMRECLTQIFGREPLTFALEYSNYGWGGVFFVNGDLAAVRSRVADNPRLKQFIDQWQHPEVFEADGPVPVAVDDWPYIYLETPSIPVLYFLLAVLLPLLWYVGTYTLNTPLKLTAGPTDMHFFFLGAAFMLLEVQNISKAAVVLGSTWQVNAVIISGILVLILGANQVVTRFPRLPAGPVYALLLATCVGLYFVDLSRFGFLPYPVKAVVVGGLTSLPMLFSGVVFARSFAAAPEKNVALGMNLMGALAGGLAQSVSFIIGIKALLLIVAALYSLAWLTRPGVKSPAPGAGVREPSPAEKVAAELQGS